MKLSKICQNKGGTQLQPRDFPRSGRKAIDVERKKERKKRENMSENNGQLRFCPPPQVEHASCLDQKVYQSKLNFYPTVQVHKCTNPITAEKKITNSEPL